MKKLFLITSFFMLSVPPLKAEEAQQNNYQEKVIKYSKTAAKVAFAGLCLHHLGKQRKFRNFIESVLQNSTHQMHLDGPFLQHFGRSSLIATIAFLTTTQSIIDDLKK